MPLECDGLTRVVCAMLKREGIEHRANAGTLEVAGVGQIGWHAWVDVGDVRIDLRARMWLGDDERVPHGAFEPTSEAIYTGRPWDASLNPIVLEIVCGQKLEDLPRFSVSKSKALRPR